MTEPSPRPEPSSGRTSSARAATRGILLVIAGVAIVHYFLHLGAIDLRSLHPPLSDAVTIDLVEELPYAEVVAETREIHFGTVAGSRHYDEPDPRERKGATGFRSVSPSDDVHYAVAIGERPRLRFHAFGGGSRVAHLEAASVTGDVQTVEVRLNNAREPVATIELQPVDERAGVPDTLPQVSIQLPDAVLRDGANTLEFRFEESVVRSFVDEPFRFRWGAAFLRMRFERDGGSDDAASAPVDGDGLAAADVPPTGGHDGGPGVVVREGTRCTFPIEIPYGMPRFKARFLIHPDDVADRRVEVVARVRVDPVGRLLLLKEAFDAAEAPGERSAVDVEVDLSLFRGLLRADRDRDPAAASGRASGPRRAGPPRDPRRRGRASAQGAPLRRLARRAAGVAARPQPRRRQPRRGRRPPLHRVWPAAGVRQGGRRDRARRRDVRRRDQPVVVHPAVGGVAVHRVDTGAARAHRQRHERRPARPGRRGRDHRDPAQARRLPHPGDRYQPERGRALRLRPRLRRLRRAVATAARLLAGRRRRPGGSDGRTPSRSTSRRAASPRPSTSTCTSSSRTPPTSRRRSSAARSSIRSTTALPTARAGSWRCCARTSRERIG